MVQGSLPKQGAIANVTQERSQGKEQGSRVSGQARRPGALAVQGRVLWSRQLLWATPPKQGDRANVAQERSQGKEQGSRGRARDRASKLTQRLGPAL